MKRLFSFLFIFLLVFSAFSPALAYTKCDGQVVFSSDCCGQRQIALTFDDGPSGENTMKILDILDKYGIKSTFFILGECAEQHPDIIKEIANRGHEIGNHSYTHTPLYKTTEKKMCDEIKKVEKLASMKDIAVTLFRPPEGKYNAELVKRVKQMGYKTVLWNIDTLDWTGIAESKIIKNTGLPRGGSIILFHDLSKPKLKTCEALELIIPELISRDYTFRTVSELIG